MNERDMILGIDLGTTFSLVAVADERGARVLRDENDDARLPSVIGVQPDEDGKPHVSVGWAARNRAVENPTMTVYSVKRLIGKGLEDVKRELPFLTYAVKGGPRDTLRVDINGRLYSPEEISSVILRTLRERAERELGQPVTKAVVTVPAYFDDAQRQATRDAGQAAGLDIVRIVNEPTAAALAYGIGVREQIEPAEQTGGSLPQASAGRVSLPTPQCPSSDAAVSGDDGSGQTVAVYDLGGGTFDVSILRIEDGVYQVLSTAGDTHLGGDDFDRRLIELVQNEVHEQFGVSINAPATRQALRTLAESIKIRLGEQESARVELDLGEGRVFEREITRAEFDALVADLVDRTLALVDSAVRDAQLSPDELERVIVVGGSTRMPVVRRRLAEHVGREPYTALNPDEVVALGAAIQASILAGAYPDMLLLDVTPLSLGIETMGGGMGKLIVRNTTVPCRATEMFTTFVDGQTAIKFNVLQGERELARDCRSLGEFVLRGIPPMPAGIPKVEVAFLLDANGILNVSATEQRSGQEASIQIMPNHGLTRDEVERISQESIEFAQADIDAHRRIDLSNQVEFDTHKAEQMLAKVGDRLPAGERAEIERAMTELRALVKESDDLDRVHQALTEFGHKTLRLAELGISDALTEGAKRQ